MFILLPQICENIVLLPRILQGAQAVDDDLEKPYSEVEYRVLRSAHSDYVSFVSANDGTMILEKTLDYETLRNFSVQIRAQDKGSPPRFSDTYLYVEVSDADDQNPKFLRDSYWGEIQAVGDAVLVLISPEPIKAVDQDQGICAAISYSLTKSLGSEHFAIDPQTGTLKTREAIYRSGLDSVTLVVRATQADNSDRYSLATVTLRIQPSLLSKNSTYEKLDYTPSIIKIKVKEDTPVGTVLLALSIGKNQKIITYTINSSNERHYFRITSDGEIILNKQLDYEENKLHRFQIIAIDDVLNTTADVEIEVIDVNEWEPRFRQTSYEFNIPKHMNQTKPIPLGKLEVADGDRNNKITVEIHGDLSKFFFIDKERHLWMSPEAPNITVMHLLATVSDNGLPSRNSTVPIKITNNAIERIESSWAGNILKAFILILTLFIITIGAMCLHIYKKNERQLVDSSQTPSTLSIKSKYVKNDAVDQPRSFLDLKSKNYHQSPKPQLFNAIKNGTMDSDSSDSVEASTMVAATLEREAQKDRDMENYTATVRSKFVYM